MSPSWRTIAAHHLDVEHPLLRLAPARLAHGCEGLEEELVERLAVLEPLAQARGRARELLVRERLEVRLERGDVVRLLREPLQTPALADAQDLLELAEVWRWPSTQGSRWGISSLRLHGGLTGSAVASVAMRRAVSTAAFLVLALATAAGAATARERQTPGRSPQSRSPAPTSATPTSTGAAATRCGSGTSPPRADRRLASHCFVSTSTGSGVAGVIATEGRALWLTYTGGNIREWSLWTKRGPAKAQPARIPAGRRGRAGAGRARARLGRVAAVRDRPRRSSCSHRTGRDGSR